MRLQKHTLAALNWAVASSFALVQFLLQASTGLMAASWQKEFALTSTQVGYLSAAFYLSYVIMQIPVGLIYDRFGARKIISVSCLLLCLGTFGLSLSHSYTTAFLSRIVMGVGSSFGFIGMLYVTASWFSGRHFAILVGISETIAMLGVAFGELAMAWVIERHGWRTMVCLAGLGILIITICATLVIRDNRNLLHDASAPLMPFAAMIRQVLSNKLIWTTGLFGFALFSIISVFVTLWGVPFFTEGGHYSLHTASAMMSMVFIGTAIGAPATGWIIDRFNIRQGVMTGFAGACFLLFGLIIYRPQLPTAWVFGLLFFVGFFLACYVQVFAIIRDNVDFRLRATALGTANMIFMFSAPILQPLVGKILEVQHSYVMALSVIEVLLLMAIGLSFYLRPKSTCANIGTYSLSKE